MASQTIAIERIGSAAANGSHNGDKTHHQDQSIKCVSFKIIKTIERRLQKPIPPPVELLFVLIFIFYIKLNYFVLLFYPSTKAFEHTLCVIEVQVLLTWHIGRKFEKYLTLCFIISSVMVLLSFSVIFYYKYNYIIADILMIT